MFIAHGFFTGFVPPEDFRIGPAIHPVHPVHFPFVQVGIRLWASSGVNVQRFVAQRQFDVIGATGADAAKLPHLFPLQRLVKGQHPGNAAFGSDFVKNICRRGSQLRLGLAEIVQHYRHRPPCFILRFHGKPRQRVCAGGDVGCRLFHHLRRLGGDGGGRLCRSGRFFSTAGRKADCGQSHTQDRKKSFQ